jgi:hypothetical protein
MSFPISLRSPLAADSPLAKMLKDGKLDADDVNALSALSGKATKVGPHLYQHKLDEADLAAAGVADPGDRQVILSALRQALKQTDGLDWNGYEPVAVSFVTSPGRKKVEPAATTLSELVIQVDRKAAPSTAAATATEFGDPQQFKAQYKRVFSQLGSSDQAILAGMLAAGKLAALDARGFCLMDHLYRLATDPVALPDRGREAELKAEGKKVAPFKGTMESLRRDHLSTLIAHLEDPSTIYQGRFGTCAATMSQVEMALNHPADYASMAVNLVGVGGVGRLPSGQTIVRVPDSLIKVSGDALSGSRPVLSAVVQAALMELNSTSAGTYSNVDDRHWREEGLEPLLATLYQAGNSQGTHSHDRAQTLSDVTGQTYTIVSVAGKADQAARTIRSELDGRRMEGDSPVCHVGMFFSPSGLHGSHAVGVTEMSNARVFYRNPWGNSFEQERSKADVAVHFDDDRQQHYVEVSDNRPGLTRIYEDGTESLTRETFLAKVHTIYVVE